MERCESGRIDVLGKHASWKRDRGFKSHPLRQCLSRVLTDYQEVGSDAPDLPTGIAVEYHNEVSPGSDIEESRKATPLPAVHRSDRPVPGAPLPTGSSTERFYRAKSEAKGLGPVQQAPVNPARSGRKQR